VKKKKKRKEGARRWRVGGEGIIDGSDWGDSGRW
jgi:hypothetical protein